MNRDTIGSIINLIGEANKMLAYLQENKENLKYGIDRNE